jgi:ParB-like chromosome segregation protein Spo0J
MTSRYNDHPFAAIWPLMTDDALIALAEDIKANGQHLPILLYQGSILDGRCRDRACGIAGVEPRYEPTAAANDDEALDLVVSLNEHRRHLSMEERAFAAARLANMKQGSHWANKRKEEKVKRSFESFTSEKPQNHSIQVYDAAKLLDVSVPAVARARVIIKHAPELEKDVVAGNASLSATAATVRSKRKAKAAAKAPEITPYQRALGNYAPKAKFLTSEEVDPDFKGTPLEFATKYGHVNLSPASEIEREAATKRAGDLMTWMKQCIGSAPAEVSDADLLIWITGDGKEPGHRREKLEKRWADFEALYSRLAGLRAKLESQLTGKPVEVKGG